MTAYVRCFSDQPTRSPLFTVRTSVPIDSTAPMNSGPMMLKVLLGGIELYGQSSLPQVNARPVGSIILGIGNRFRAHILCAVTQSLASHTLMRPSVEEPRRPHRRDLS